MNLMQNAYEGALKAPQGGQSPIPDPPLPRQAPNVNPMTQNGDVFFVDPSLFSDKNCKVGDEVLLKATVQSKGSKVGLTPVEIVMEGESGEEMGDEGQDGY